MSKLTPQQIAELSVLISQTKLLASSFSIRFNSEKDPDLKDFFNDLGATINSVRLLLEHKLEHRTNPAN